MWWLPKILGTARRDDRLKTYPTFASGAVELRIQIGSRFAPASRKRSNLPSWHVAEFFEPLHRTEI